MTHVSDTLRRVGIRLVEAPSFSVVTQEHVAGVVDSFGGHSTLRQIPIGATGEALPLSVVRHGNSGMGTVPANSTLFQTASKVATT